MIYLVRHGQSEWNALRRTQGQTAHPALTDSGRRQAAAAGAAICTDLDVRTVGEVEGISEIVTSDLLRAVETAELIAGIISAPVRLDPRLREQALGAYEGLGYDETFAVAAHLDWSDPDLCVGGGESARDVSDRVAAALGDLAGDRATVVVTHGDAIRSALGWAAGLAPGQAPWVEVPNGAVAVLERGLPARWLPAALPGDI